MLPGEIPLNKGYELDRILFRVKKESVFQEKFFKDFENACNGYNLTEEEKLALKSRDFVKLYELGTKDELILALARLLKDRKLPLRNQETHH